MTIAYSTKELAEAGLIERIEDVKKYFRENDYELFDDMTKIESDYDRMVTERDDWYCCWIEEIDMFNEYNMSEVIKTVSGEDVVTATTTIENHMNKYRLRWVKTYDEIDAVRENIQYERIYWPKSQIFYDYIDMDFETNETFDDDELMIFSGYDEDSAPYTYVSLNALLAIYRYERSINNPDYDMPKLNEKECSNVNCEFQDLADDLPF